MADTSLASNNPFRRKSTVPVTSPTSSSAASGLALDTSSTAPPPGHSSLAKSSTFPQSPSDANAHSFATNAGAAGAPGHAGNSGSAEDSYSFNNEDQDALRGRPQVSSDAFREHLQALPKSTEAPPSTTFLKPKPVKKVRVQSPPPSSPSSVDSTEADFESRFPSNLSGGTAGQAAGAPPTTSFGDYGTRGSLLDDRPIRNYDDYSSESEDSESDDNSAGRGGNTGSSTAASSFPSFQTQAQQQPPPNPFEKTLDDLEPGQKSSDEADPATASAGKATMDVDAFSRLLLTGQGPTAAAPPPPPPARADAAALPQESQTPRTSHDISENDDDQSGLIHGAPPASETTPKTLRKKPPPPSSRHGKLIKAQPKDKAPAKETGSEYPAPPSSDVNKPLPPPPARRAATLSDDDEDAMDSIFDREAAGKVPEVDLDPEAPDEALPSPRPPTPPNASHSVEFSPTHPISDLGAEALVSSNAVPVPPVAAPPAAPAAAVSSPHPKKPTPAPPPRRQAAGHNRTESRSNPPGERPPLPAPPPQIGEADLRDKSPLASPRSSIDSGRSRSSSIIKPTPSVNPSAGANVPAPPPPRRVNHASRPSTTSFAAPLHPSASTPALSPSAISDNDRSPGIPPQANSSSNSGSGNSTPVPTRLLAKPPPPPARNTSVRHKEGRPAALASNDSSGSVGGVSGSGRPSSVASFDAVARRVGTHHHPPPPPPTRQRGSSRGSMDGPAATNQLLSAPPSISSTPRKVSSESVRRAAGSSGGGGLAPAAEGDEDQAESGADSGGVANNILADLDALRREVDALRGQFKAE